MGWTIADRLLAEHLYELRQLTWRYTAIHFEDGAKVPLPERIPYPGSETPDEESRGWEMATLEDLMSPEVRALMQGG